MAIILAIGSILYSIRKKESISRKARNTMYNFQLVASLAISA